MPSQRATAESQARQPGPATSRPARPPEPPHRWPRLRRTTARPPVPAVNMHCRGGRRQGRAGPEMPLLNSCAAPGRSAASWRSCSAASQASVIRPDSTSRANMDVCNWKPHVRGVERAGRNGVSGFRGGDRLGDAASVPGGNDDCPRRRSACKSRQFVQDEIVCRFLCRCWFAHCRPIHCEKSVDAAAGTPRCGLRRVVDKLLRALGLRASTAWSWRAGR